MKDLDEILKKTIEHMKEVSDEASVLGAPVAAEDGTVVIPVNRVSYGFVVGGGEYGTGKDGLYPGAAASGGGVTVTPVGFFVSGREKRFISMNCDDKPDKWKDCLRALLRTVKGEKDE